MIKVKSKINVHHSKGNIKIDDIGTVDEIYFTEQHLIYNDKIPIYFRKHQRVFYWYPVWMKPDEFDIIPNEV